MESESTEVVFEVKISMVEVYREKVRDLLDVNKVNLAVASKQSSPGMKVIEVSEHFITKQQEVLDLLALGNKNRKTGNTEMNDQSSRSHSIFSMTVSIKRDQYT